MRAASSIREGPDPWQAARAEQLKLNQWIERIGLRDHDMATDGNKVGDTHAYPIARLKVVVGPSASKASTPFPFAPTPVTYSLRLPQIEMAKRHRSI